MSDFLSRLAQRQLGQIVSVEPCVREFYAPVSASLPLPSDAAAAVDSMTAPRISGSSMPLVAAGNAINSRATSLPGRQPEASPTSSGEQRPEGNSDSKKKSRGAIESFNAHIADLVIVNAPVELGNVAISPAARLVTAQSSGLPSQQGSRAAREPADRDAPRRLIETPVTSAAAAAPPRLGPTASGRVRAPVLEAGQADSEPPVHVTIGRVEVTAVTAAPTPRRAAPARKPAMSLDDYLARRRRREP